MKRTQTTALAPAQKRTLLFIAAAALGLTVLLANYLAPRNVPSVDPTVSIERAQNDDSSTSRAATMARSTAPASVFAKPQPLHSLRHLPYR
jgi:hypothetical protein